MNRKEAIQKIINDKRKASPIPEKSHDKKPVFFFGLVFLFIIILLYRFIFRDEYIEVGDLSDRLTNEPQLLREIVKDGEVIANSQYQLEEDTPYYPELKKMFVKRPFFCTRFLNSWHGILQAAF